MAKLIQLLDTQLVLLSERALLLPEYATLVVADWHLGKASHFRKAGIFMPLPTVDSDIIRLQRLLTDYHIKTLVLLGDLFHSDLNSEWLEFRRFREANPTVRFVLTLGNHDILPEHLFLQTNVELMTSYTIGEKIRCTHEPDGEPHERVLNIAGHIHPGCLIHYRGRQVYRLPCFYYHRQTLLLPAFGKLTGLHMMPHLADSRIFPILGDQVSEWKKS